MTQATKWARSVYLLATVMCSLPTTTWAAELTILCSQGLKFAVEELALQFEKTTGDRLAITYDTSARLKANIELGKNFDVTILTPPLIEALIQQGRVIEGSAVELARTSLGLAVKKGAARPDITSTEALKTTLINARSIAYVTSGASGMLFLTALHRLGIADEVQEKLKRIPMGLAGEVVIRNEVDIAVQTMPELLAVSGLDVIGSFPAELEASIVLSGGVSSATAYKSKAASFIRFLQKPTSMSVMLRKGLKKI